MDFLHRDPVDLTKSADITLSLLRKFVLAFRNLFSLAEAIFTTIGKRCG